MKNDEKNKKTKTNSVFPEDKANPSKASTLEEEKVFKHGFGSIKKVTTQQNMPVYATSKICMYYWET
jgi:hypothetical protein